MSDGRFDGLVWYSGSFPPENRAMIMNCSVPLVLIHTPSSYFDDRFPSVICDNDQGIGLGVKHLAELGHKKIAFLIEGEVPSLEALLRRDAFLKHMAEYGLPTPESCVIHLGWDGVGLDEYLASGPPHTALIAQDEATAATVLLKSPIYGIRIPEDLSVVGFDSTAYCNELQPRLTAINQPLVALGNSAIDLLVSVIKDQAAVPREIVIPCGFDIRGSTQSINSE